MEHDQLEITTLVRSERLNPNGLDWPRFVVATYEAMVVGAIQLRKHLDGSNELGSLVVRKDLRRRRVASRLIDTLLRSVHGRVLMITGARFAAHYARWGFHRIGAGEAPSPILRNYVLGQLIGGAFALFSGRIPNRLAILDRKD
jgi:amino-acid N-acetyltransferase